MNNRHAAALALVGWHLMVPPMAHKEGLATWRTANHSAAEQMVYLEFV
jgi:hypothetical protein